MRWLIAVILILMCNVVQAQISIKSDIATDKILSKPEQAQVKEYLKGKILNSLVPAKNDYTDEFNRGTVEFSSKTGVNILGDEVLEQSNYVYHKIIIPDGTIIKGVNFAQKNPHTQSISGKNLTFIDCNLTNVERDPTWILISSINRHMTFEIVEEEGKTYEIQYIEKDGKMVENQRTDITPVIILHP